MATYPPRSPHARHETCSDHVIGAILSGWRYDISGVPPDLRKDYEKHLVECAHCRRRQRLHRTVDLLLMTVTSLSIAAFMLAALVMHRLETIRHLRDPQLHLHIERSLALVHIPSSITISLEAVAIAGVVISVLLWSLVLMATPLPGMISAAVQEHISPELRDRLWKHAA